jgi:hypothetical protein
MGNISHTLHSTISSRCTPTASSLAATLVQDFLRGNVLRIRSNITKIIIIIIISNIIIIINNNNNNSSSSSIININIINSSKRLAILTMDPATLHAVVPRQGTGMEPMGLHHRLTILS